MARPLKYNNCLDLDMDCEMYFEECAEHELQPTVSGLACYLDVDRKTITNYQSRDKFFPTIKRAKARIEAHLEQFLYNGQVTGVIFNLKNNFGWVDKQELDQRTEHKLSDDTTRFLEKVTNQNAKKVWKK